LYGQQGEAEAEKEDSFHGRTFVFAAKIMHFFSGNLIICVPKTFHFGFFPYLRGNFEKSCKKEILRI